MARQISKGQIKETKSQKLSGLQRPEGAGAFQTHDKFFSEAQALKAEFDKRFANPRSNDRRRFEWDYWHVPDQYTLLRTPAYHFFSRRLYRQLHESLLHFGREHLGCFNITPPWLSYYIDGCRQELHADIPHGPWAFVYSLTEWETRHFIGGETLLLNQETLNYWRHFSEFSGVENHDLVTKIPALFNRLVIFDPRVPHGVTPVYGVQEPRKARIVVHGWFTEPQPYIVGPLQRAKVTTLINEALNGLAELIQDFGSFHGTLSLRFQISTTGEVIQQKILTNTLLSLGNSIAENDSNELVRLTKGIRKMLSQLKFPSAAKPTHVTLPLLFR